MNRNAVPISVEVDGVRLSGFYAVQSDMLTVWHAYLGSRTRTICGGFSDADVEGMLAELFQARQAQARPVARFFK